MSLTMSPTRQDEEAEFLENLRSAYESKGCRFVVHPRQSELPDFFASYVPDAVAIGKGQNIAIEVKSRAGHDTQPSIQKIRKLFEGQSDWQFTVAYMGSDALRAQQLPSAERTAVLERARAVDQLIDEDHLREAFVAAWSLLEAALNSIHADADKRPRMPGTVIQTLAMNGHISSETERSLRNLIGLRDRVVHGDLTVEPTIEEVRLVLSAVNAVLQKA